MIRVTKIFTFETAHVLYGYDGKCKNIHGHSYKLFVTIKGKPIDDINNEKNGMVLDFGDLKAIVKEEIVDEWDHGLMVNALSPHKDLGKELEQKGHIFIVIISPLAKICSTKSLIKLKKDCRAKCS